jgi:two-component system phosphate regulon sensor histidine kinase PhoR
MIRRKKLLWRLYPPYLAITLAALVSVAIYSTRETRSTYLEQTASDLENRARLVEQIIRGRTGFSNSTQVTAACVEMGKLTSTRYTVVLVSGLVIGDSERDPASMDDHSDRPEIREAYAGRVGRSTRHSDTLERQMMYVAVPVLRDGHVVAVMRASVPVTALATTLRAIYTDVTLAGLVIALVAALVSLLVARRINRPLGQMKRGAERFAAGDLDYRLTVPDAEETGVLAESMNRMAAQLDERIRTVTRQRNELEAVLTSMIEAVLVVDTDGQVIKANDAAGQLFGLDPERVRGRSIQEAIHNADLNRFVTRALDSVVPVEDEILLHRREETFLQAHGSTLRDASGRAIGALVVMHDVTRLKKLERVRSDFVANVSHELKTPITSIHGFVETLRDGALDDRGNAERFLEIIGRQAERLNAIIEDLLSLSRIEQENDTGQIVLEPSKVGMVIKSAMSTCSRKAMDRDIELENGGENSIEVPMNAPLLEQALVNLIDNAIKYSDGGATVRISTEATDTELVLSVSDSGCGIGSEHLSRLFERFYRVDKARSREDGGTGLGLAIVKHIAAAHRGRVSVKSALGKGSTFRIHLPWTPDPGDNDSLLVS